MFLRKLSIGRPRLTHICGTLNSQRFYRQFALVMKMLHSRYLVRKFTCSHVCVILATLATKLAPRKSQG